MRDLTGERRLWPRGLPCPDLTAISFTPDGGELATEMESGARRNRQLYDTLPTTYKATMTCDRLRSAGVPAVSTIVTPLSTTACAKAM